MFMSMGKGDGALILFGRHTASQLQHTTYESHYTYYDGYLKAKDIVGLDDVNLLNL